MAIREGGTLLLLYFLPFVLGGTYLVLSGVNTLVLWLRLRRGDPATLESFESGPVEVEGTAAQLETTVDAPFESDTQTLLYDYELARWAPVQGRSTSNTWRPVDNEQQTPPFVVTVDGEDVVVDPTHADVSLYTKERYRLDSDEERTGMVADYIEARDDLQFREPVENTFADDITNYYRLTVSRLDPGDTCYVTGTLVSAAEADIDAGGHDWVVQTQPRSLTSLLRSGVPLQVFGGGESEGLYQLRESALKRLLVGVPVVGFSVWYLQQTVFV